MVKCKVDWCDNISLGSDPQKTVIACDEHPDYDLCFDHNALAGNINPHAKEEAEKKLCRICHKWNTDRGEVLAIKLSFPLDWHKKCWIDFQADIQLRIESGPTRTKRCIKCGREKVFGSGKKLIKQWYDKKGVYTLKVKCPDCGAINSVSDSTMRESLLLVDPNFDFSDLSRKIHQLEDENRANRGKKT